MGLSVGSMRPISSVSFVTRSPQMYAVDNESEVSAAYAESVARPENTGGGIGSVGSARPVQYANTKTTAASPMEETQRVSRAYNDIASSFSGLTTSYTQDMSGVQYGVAGSNIDVYVSAAGRRLKETL